jgi:hypothetical protein
MARDGLGQRPAASNLPLGGGFARSFIYADCVEKLRGPFLPVISESVEGCGRNDDSSSEAQAKYRCAEVVSNEPVGSFSTQSAMSGRYSRRSETTGFGSKRNDL